jgi:predicted NodU family carbamoyl transferase
MYILGINAYHAGASACLIKDGQFVAAVEEERFRRMKYWAGFPTELWDHRRRSQNGRDRVGLCMFDSIETSN